MKSLLYINEGSFFTDGEFDSQSQYIILVTGILKGGNKKGFYSLKYIASSNPRSSISKLKLLLWNAQDFEQRLSEKFRTNHKDTYGYDYPDYLNLIQPINLVRYIHWPIKLPLFHKILKGEYKRI